VHDAYTMKKTNKYAPKTQLRPLYQRTCIRAWREYRDMSQEELAEKVGEYLLEAGISDKGYSYASIGRIENGRMPYSQPIMEGISAALRVPVATLIAQPPPKEGEEAPPDQETLLKLWNDVNRAVRR
jgi:transcriptional regulator with XRE-family HTH domain